MVNQGLMGSWWIMWIYGNMNIWDIPSGYVKTAIVFNGHRNVVRFRFPNKNGDVLHSDVNVYQRVPHPSGHVSSQTICRTSSANMLDETTKKGAVGFSNKICVST